MPYLGRVPTGVGSLTEFDGDLKITGQLTSNDTLYKIIMDASDGSATDLGDNILIEAGGTDGSGTNAEDDICLETELILRKQVGTDTIWIPAVAMRPTVSNGCAGLTEVETTSGRPDMSVLDFDASSDEFSQFQITMPSSWNEGTITARFYWTTTATDSDGVTWGLQGVCVSDSDTIDVAYGTVVLVNDDAFEVAEDLCVTAESDPTTIGGTPTAGDLAYFRVSRDVSDANDTVGEDARLLGVKIFFTTNAATDDE